MKKSLRPWRSALGLALLGACTWPAQAGLLYFDYNQNSLGISTDTPSLFLFGKAGQTATVSNLAGFNQTVTLDAQGFYNLGISTAYQQGGTGIRNTGFQISSSDAIAGYFINRRGFTTDMSYLLDATALGTKYTVASIGGGFGEGSQVAIHATTNNTQVTFTPKGGSAITVTLQAGETYKYAGGTVDLTGSTISADKAVAVFSGHECAQVPVGTTYCDTLLEQAIPDANLSKTYLLSASKGAVLASTASDLVRVIATVDGTQIKVNGVVVATLNAGQFYEYSLAAGTGSLVEASEKVAVAQYLKGGLGNNTDPAMSYVPGADTWLKNYRLATPSGAAAFDLNYASVVIDTDDLASLKLNGAAVNTAGFSAIGGTGYSRGVVDLPLGLFDLTASSEFLTMLGGGSSADSYFTYGGATFAPGISPAPPSPSSGVPEPVSLALVATALGGALFGRRRRHSRPALS